VELSWRREQVMEGIRSVAMMQEFAERRTQFRFPVVLPVEYYKRNGSSISSYSLDISKCGAFVSSDDPLGIGSRCGMRLMVPIDHESSKLFNTDGTVVWNKILPFKSKRNGMGIEFSEPLPENLLLNALADTTKKLTKETEIKKRLEEKVEKLELELEESTRVSALGRCMEKILFDLSNPILVLSGKLEIIKNKLHEHRRTLEQHECAHKADLLKISKEFNTYCKNIDQILKDYKVISELAHLVGADSSTIEKKLQKYGC
jgi:Tfp pilus assembly protein PilZ